MRSSTSQRWARRPCSSRSRLALIHDQWNVGSFTGSGVGSGCGGRQIPRRTSASTFCSCSSAFACVQPSATLPRGHVLAAAVCAEPQREHRRDAPLVADDVACSWPAHRFTAFRSSAFRALSSRERTYASRGTSSGRKRSMRDTISGGMRMGSGFLLLITAMLARAGDC
jgi:hypothetical protein